jgi:hypothetical protein
MKPFATMLSVGVLLLVSFLLAVPSTSGFVAVGPTSITTSRCSTLASNLPQLTWSASSTTSSTSSLYAISTNSSRRNFVQQSSIALLTTTLPSTALAKDVEPITRQTVTDAFQSIRSELTSTTGLISTLTNLINNNSYPEVMQYTKESDAYFRKAKLGKARKLLTDGSLKGDAILMSNAVTFDLIGINRASRPGQENRDEQMKYLEELRKDIERFLELESTIVVAGE